jgi:glycosyltransferase involved in cell wall biosynthesis
MLAVHRMARTWVDGVTTFIALSEFSRRKFTEGGLPDSKIRVKPNFVSPDPGEKDGAGDDAVFVGRLSPEKGVKSLLRAWGQLRVPVPLRILGDGPLRGELEQMVCDLKLSKVTFLGHVDYAATQSAIKNARFLVLPSECYENFPLTIVEALSCGTPVICSRLGAMQEIVTDRGTGLHFMPGNPDDLADKVAWAWDHPRQVTDMGKAARQEYEQKYTAENNYQSLMSIYQHAIAA